MALTLANRITVIRLLLVPLFILLILYYDTSFGHAKPVELLRWFATGVFLLVFFLDAVDGHVARSRCEVSKLGTVLDPLADKAMLLSALFLFMRSSLAFTPILPLWFVLLVISRDAMLIVGGLIIQSLMGNVTVRARLSGKATTFFQMLVIIWILIGLPERLFLWPVGCAAFFTVLSATQYLFDGVRQLDKAK